MSTPSNNSQMHNDIYIAGSRERTPMLAPGHYAQWSSRFMRYIDTKSNKNELRKLTDAEAEAIHMILNGIGDNIYSTVDVCSTAREMWLAIECLQQGESINKQDVKTKLFWEFGKFTSRDGELIESYYSRFYKMINEMQQQELETISYHRLFDILKQHQNEVNEIRDKKIARNANPLALVAAAQYYPDKYSSDPYYQAPKPHKTYTSSSSHKTTSSSHATTRNKSKEIAKRVTPPSVSPSKEDSDPEQAQRDKDMQKNLALISKYIKNIYKPTNNNLRTSSNTRNKTVDTSPIFGNDRQSRQFGNQKTVTVAGARETECRKPKRAKYYAYHKEKMMLWKQEEKGVPLNTEQGDWLADADDEPDE
ncbi:hypothetical protein Tco_0532446 [Tanacetum coccineum]